MNRILAMALCGTLASGFVQAAAQGNVSGSYTMSATSTSATVPDATEVPTIWIGGNDLLEPDGSPLFTGTGTLNSQSISESGQVIGSSIQFTATGYVIAGKQTQMFFQGTVEPSGTIDGQFFGGTVDLLTTWTGTWVKVPVGPICTADISGPDCLCKRLKMDGNFLDADSDKVIDVVLSPDLDETHDVPAVSDNPDLVTVSPTVISKLKCGSPGQFHLIPTPNASAGKVTVTVTVVGIASKPIPIDVYTLRTSIVPREITSVTVPITGQRLHELSVADAHGEDKTGDFYFVFRPIEVESRANGILMDTPRTIESSFDIKFELTVIGRNSDPCGTEVDIVKADYSGEMDLHFVVASADSTATQAYEVTSDFFSSGRKIDSHPDGPANPRDKVLGQLARFYNPVKNLTHPGVATINHPYFLEVKVTETAKANPLLAWARCKELFVILIFEPKCPAKKVN